MNIRKVLLVIFTFAIYSCSSIFSKTASTHEFLSVPYLMCFAGVLMAMAAYAVMWQKVLSFMQLNKAFLLKSMTIFIILAISHFVFDESISINNIIGAMFILMGIVVLSWKK